MAVTWAERISAFCRSPSRFLSGTTAEAFLAELLRELRDDRASYSVKVLLLSPLSEHPALLCPSESVGEETALELMSVFAQCPPKAVQFRCHLLLALTSVLVCTLCVSSHSRVFQDFLDLLLQLAQDTSDLHGDGAFPSLRATACDCLREMEACSPALLSQRLELLGGLRQREASRLHQAYAGLRMIYARYVQQANGVDKSSAEEDIQRAFRQQCDHLERTVASLKARLAKSTEEHERVYVRIMKENVTLITEINELRKELRSAKTQLKEHKAQLATFKKFIKSRPNSEDGLKTEPKHII